MRQDARYSGARRLRAVAQNVLELMHYVPATTFCILYFKLDISRHKFSRILFGVYIVYWITKIKFRSRTFRERFKDNTEA